MAAAERMLAPPSRSMPRAVELREKALDAGAAVVVDPVVTVDVVVWAAVWIARAGQVGLRGGGGRERRTMIIRDRRARNERLSVDVKVL
jgi:PHP family Zn ribbon phosphoesterase